MSTNYSPFLLGARYLNDVNAATLGSGGTDTRNLYTGALGQEVRLSAAEAVQLTNTAATGYSSTTPLLAGTYKLVKVKSTTTITPARGLVAWWDASAALDSFIVTPDAPTAATQMAGVFIGAPTAGYYCWILIQGEGYLLGKASALTQTGAAGQYLNPVTATGAWDNPAAVAITDSTTGTATTNTFAAGVGQYVLPIHCTLAQVTGAGDILTNHVLGHKFKILSIDAVVDKVVTTGAKLFTANLEIGTTDVTGGTVALTSATCTPLGARVAGSAITAANTGSASDTISIEASSVTAFTEGEVIFLIRIQNMDTADAIAGIATRLSNRNSNIIAFETPVAATLKRAYIGPLVSSPISGQQ